MTDTKKTSPRIILFDLETLPNLPEALKVWTQLDNFPGRTMRATITTIICAGWKELGKKHTHCINAWDYKEWKKDVNDDKKLVQEIYNVLKEADVVVTQNGKRFDWKYLQTRLMFHGLDPLGKIHHIDTVVLARSNLFNFSNSLGNLGELLVNERKMKHSGWKLWVDVHGRCKKAMNKMEAYCKQDVKLLEKVFIKLRPFVNNMPCFDTKGIKSCPTCNSQRLHSNGVRRTKTQIYRRYQCIDCGTWSRTDLKDNNPRTF